MSSQRHLYSRDEPALLSFIRAILLVFIVLVAPASAAVAGDVYFSFSSNNVQRGAQVYVPAGYSSAHRHPLLVVLHPSNGTGAGMEQISNLDPQADSAGFLVAYPDSIGPRWDTDDATDTTFIMMLIAKLSAKWSLDPQRVYVAGYSDGGGFAQLLACTQASVFAGLATVAASMGDTEETQCHPSVPVTYLTFHGTADPLVPFYGGTRLGPYSNGSTAYPMSQVFAFWAGLDGCTSSQPIKTLSDKLAAGGATSDIVYSQTSCRNGTSATFYAINGGGHTWPGGTQSSSSNLGDVSQNLNASAIIVKTMAAHRSSAPNKCFVGTTLACTVAHGTGTGACVGGQPAQCTIAACDRGYVLQGGICASQ